jgi:Sigma-70 region 3
MLNYLSRMPDRTGIVTPSESARRKLAKYRECKSNFSAKHSRAPTLHEMVEQLEVPLEKFLPIIHMGRPVASLDAFISQTTCGTKRSARIEGARDDLHELLPDTSEVTPGNDLEDLKKAIAQALSGLNETEHIAAAFYLEMYLHDVGAETTYPLAAAWISSNIRPVCDCARWCPARVLSPNNDPRITLSAKANRSRSPLRRLSFFYLAPGGATSSFSAFSRSYLAIGPVR